MPYLNPVLPTPESHRPLFLTGAVCLVSLLFWEAPAQCATAVLACLFGFGLRRRESQKRCFARGDQSLQWW